MAINKAKQAYIASKSAKKLRKILSRPLWQNAIENSSLFVDIEKTLYEQVDQTVGWFKL